MPFKPVYLVHNEMELQHLQKAMRALEAANAFPDKEFPVQVERKLDGIEHLISITPLPGSPSLDCLPYFDKKLQGITRNSVAQFRNFMDFRCGSDRYRVFYQADQQEKPRQ